MADLRNLSKIYNTLAEACQKTFEPSENQAQVHAQHQTFVQAKRDLTRASNGASSQAKEITEMIHKRYEEVLGIRLQRTNMV